MAFETNCKNETLEYYIWLIVVKLCVLIGIHTIKIIWKVSATYKNSLKRKYTAKNIEAPKPIPVQRNHIQNPTTQ